MLSESCALCGGDNKFQVEDLPVGPRWFCTEKCYAQYAGLPVKESGYYGLEAESFEARGYEPDKPFYATTHENCTTTVMHPIKCGHYKMVMNGTGVWMSPTFYDTIEEMFTDKFDEIMDTQAEGLIDYLDTEIGQETKREYQAIKTIGDARKFAKRNFDFKIDFAPCFRKERDYDSKALNALPITVAPIYDEDYFDAESFEATEWVGFCPECNKWRTKEMSKIFKNNRKDKDDAEYITDLAFNGWTIPKKLLGKQLCMVGQRFGGNIHGRTDSFTGYGQRTHNDSYCGTPLTKVKSKYKSESFEAEDVCPICKKEKHGEFPYYFTECPDRNIKNYNTSNIIVTDKHTGKKWKVVGSDSDGTPIWSKASSKGKVAKNARKFTFRDYGAGWYDRLLKGERHSRHEAQPKRTERELMEEIYHNHTMWEYGPENLWEDGEASLSRVKEKLATSRRKIKIAEKELGRKVSQAQAIEWARKNTDYENYNAESFEAEEYKAVNEPTNDAGLITSDDKIMGNFHFRKMVNGHPLKPKQASFIIPIEAFLKNNKEYITLNQIPKNARHLRSDSTKDAESKKLPPVEKAGITGIASGATMEGLETLLAAESESISFFKRIQKRLSDAGQKKKKSSARIGTPFDYYTKPNGNSIKSPLDSWSRIYYYFKITPIGLQLVFVETEDFKKWLNETYDSKSLEYKIYDELFDTEIIKQDSWIDSKDDIYNGVLDFDELGKGNVYINDFDNETICSHDNLGIKTMEQLNGELLLTLVCDACGKSAGTSAPLKQDDWDAESFAADWNEHTCEHCGSTDIDLGNNWKCHDCGRYAAEEEKSISPYLWGLGIIGILGYAFRRKLY